jgi:hypothetical protein
MHSKKLLGILIIVLALLTFSLNIMLAQIAMILDETTGTFWHSINKYFPYIVYFNILIPLIIGVYLIYCAYKEKK